MNRKSFALAAATIALGASGAAYAQAPVRAPAADLTRAAFAERANSVFERMDANRDGTINQADRAARQAERFARIDSNGDGEVSQAEMQASQDARKAKMAERRAAREAKSGDRMAQRFARLDTDGSGTISQAEMQAARAKRGEARAERGAAGGEGMERRGMRGGHKAGHKAGGGRGMKMWGAVVRQADTNNDGAVTRAEFDSAVQAHFARLDTDGNGTVTAAERQASRAAAKAQWQQRRAAQQ